MDQKYVIWIGGFGVAEVLARQAAVQGSIPPIHQNSSLSHIEGDSECQVCWILVGGRGHLAEDTSPFTEQPPERFVNETCMEHPAIGPQNSAISLIRAIEVHGYTIGD